MNIVSAFFSIILENMKDLAFKLIIPGILEFIELHTYKLDLVYMIFSFEYFDTASL